MNLAGGLLFAGALFLSNNVAIAQNGSIDLTVTALDAAWEKRSEMHKAYQAFVEKKAPIPQDYEVAWRAARAVYFWGFFALPPDFSDKDKKVDAFKYGADAADVARKLSPGRVEGHYWYGVLYGSYGTARGIRASLGGAASMRDSLTEAIKIDPTYHYCGAYRIRGRLYWLLPSLISFGDNKKAYEDTKKATECQTKSKLSYVYFAEVQAKVDNKAAALKTLEEAKSLPDIVGSDEEKAYRRDIEALEKKLK